MAKKAETTRPGQKFLAGAVEEPLHKAVSQLATKMNMNITQFLRHACVEVLKNNFVEVPAETQRELERDSTYRFGRPRKDGQKQQVKPAVEDVPDRPAKVVKLSVGGRKPAGTE